MRTVTEAHRVVRKDAPVITPTSTVWWAAGVSLAGSLILACIFALLHRAVQVPERAVLAVGFVCACVIAAYPVFHFSTRRNAPIADAAIGTLSAISAVLVAIYFYWVGFYVFFPADALIWSEGDFVNDIIKFRTGYPLFTAQVNNESFTYVPGAQLLTYALASISGHGNSVPAFRVVQVLYSIAAAAAGVFCYMRIIALSDPGRERGSRCWPALSFSVLMLAATNSITNRFTHNLHNDALAQVITVASFALLLEYIRTRSKVVLALMAIMPAAGFFVKQSLAIWTGFYWLYLLLFDKPRSVPRLLAHGFTSLAAIAGVIGACYAAWGQNFTYWTITVLGSHGVSPLRSLQHLLDIWPYLTIGLLGGVALRSTPGFKHLVGPWLIWLALIVSQTYTSGIAWMLNHIGPGCFIAAIWFLAGLRSVWNQWFDSASSVSSRIWLEPVTAVVVIALTFSGLGFIRIPMRSFSDDAYRYVRDIEMEFQGQPSGRVLMDAGSWIYARDNVVMKDRAPCIGERGYSQTGDFSGILGRIRNKQYTKILVRNLHEPDFWYDHFLWPKPSGIRDALLANYHQVRRIKPAASPLSLRDRAEDPYLFSEITVLAPNGT